MQLNALDRSIMIAEKKLLSGETFIFSVIVNRICVNTLTKTLIYLENILLK